ncbi:MAG: CBS domain-containing protein [Arenicella sp.]|nr:CBS domain-containing protein [Arenicella sp.]
MFRSVKLKDYMLVDPVKIKPDEDIFEAIHLILVHRLSGLCVVDDSMNMLGVLSEMDCLKAVLSSVYNDSPQVAGRVSDFMTKDVVSVKIDDNIVDVASDMLKHKHRRRPVIDEDGKLLGQVSCRRLLRAVKDFSGPG